MSFLFFVDGVVTDLRLMEPAIVAHVCNESGIWSGRICKEISAQWPESRSSYYQWYRQRTRNDFAIGRVQFVNIPSSNLSKRIRIANMVAQTNRTRPVKYSAFENCLAEVARKAKQIGASVHLTKLDYEQTDSWPDLLQIIQRQLSCAEVSVFIYDDGRSTAEQWFGAVIDC